MFCGWALSFEPTMRSRLADVVVVRLSAVAS